MKMKSTRFRHAIALLILAYCPLVDLPSTANAGTTGVSPKAMVATVHPTATDAAVDVLRRGGETAIDAAVAAGLMLGVVDAHNSGIGGGCFMVIHLADGQLVAIDGREMAPKAATRDMYLRDGRPQPELSRTGPLASGVPGALAAYEEAVRCYGHTKLADLLAPAADAAEQGFPVTQGFANRVRVLAKALRRFEGSREVFFKPDGSPYTPGDVFCQPDLARTYRAIAERGIGWFYRGPFAEATGRWMAENGGLITAEDLAAYHTKRRTPVVTTYRGYTIVGFPPPSSGGTHVAQILNMLECFDLKTLHRDNPVTFYHVIAESMKLAFADRGLLVGRPRFLERAARTRRQDVCA